MKVADSPPSLPQQGLDRRYVIGTAGHVDHGKSTLVRALTGIDPDRLAEEHRREMTIDLGFAWFTLPDGRAVSVVDVPGHERFVRNMLAGVGGIDIAMLVIAADDGPMPQTREHLAILDLLGIDHGVIALSRTDLVDDEWQALVTEEIRELLASSSLANAPVVPVSAVTGAGVDELILELGRLLDGAHPRDANGQPRLPVDRSFRVQGFGTVVTGTLLDGEIHVGQELTVYPAGMTVRVRGLQEHQQQVDRVRAGSRVAVNLGGIDSEQINRGDVLAPSNALTPSMRLDCRIALLPDAPALIEQNDEVIVFSGSSEIPARVTLLDQDTLAPGEDAWIQLRLAASAVALRGDRVILRRPSPAATIGGGVVADPAPRRHKRFQADVIRNLETLAEGTPEDLLLHELGDGIVEAGTLERRLGMPGISALLADLVARGDVLLADASDGEEAAIDASTMVLRQAVFERYANTVESALARHHRAHPLSAGIRRDDLRGVLNIRSQKPFDALLRAFQLRDLVRTDNAVVSAPGFEIHLDTGQREMADAFLAAARSDPFAPPAPEAHGMPPELVEALAATGEVERITHQIVYPMDVFETIRQRVLDKLNQNGQITLAEYRDLFGTSRKYAQPTLEHLDEHRVTRRKGDVRVRFVGPGAAT